LFGCGLPRTVPSVAFRCPGFQRAAIVPREEVIPLAEETLIVGKHTVTSGTTTVRRYVVEVPESSSRVELYDEKVVVERRKPVTDAVTGGDPDGRSRWR
jgi:hypothetical protein